MEWIFIIAIGFICIACPILILLYLQWMPWYVAVIFALWIIACITTVVFSKSKNKKWYEILLPSFIFTFIFTIVFMTSMDVDHYMFDENTGLWVIAPACSLPAFYLIGKWLNGKWLVSQEAKRVAHNKAIDKQIANTKIEIQRLECAIKDKVVAIHLLDVLGRCGADISQLECDPRICDITKTSDGIEKKRKEIWSLEKTKK